MKKGLKNYLYQTAYQLLIVLTPLLTAPCLARALGTEGIGIYSYTANFANFFLMFAMLGMANYGARYIAQNRDDKQKLGYSFYSIYFCQCICTGLMIVLYTIYLLTICNVNLLASILQVMLIFSGFFDVCWFFRGIEDFQTIIKRNIVIKLAIVASILLFVKCPDDLLLYIIIMSGGTLLSQFLIFTQVRKVVDFVKPSWKDVFSHLLPNFVLFLPEITSSLYNSMDKLMVGQMSSMSQLGLYENAEKLTGIPTSLITSLGIVLLPRITNLLSTGDKKKADEIFNISFLYVMFLGSGLVFGLLGVSEAFVPVFFGEEFIELTTFLPYLAPSILFLCLVTNIRSQILLPNKLDKQYLYSTIVGASINLGLNFMLIPSQGALGASAATLVAYIALFLFQGMCARKYTDLIGNSIINIPFVLIGFLMYLLIRNISFGNGIMTVIVRVIIGGFVYLAGSIVFVFIFRKRELNSFASYFNLTRGDKK